MWLLIHAGIKCKYMFLFPLKNLAHKGLRTDMILWWLYIAASISFSRISFTAASTVSLTNGLAAWNHESLFEASFNSGYAPQNVFVMIWNKIWLTLKKKNHHSRLCLYIMVSYIIVSGLYWNRTYDVLCENRRSCFVQVESIEVFMQIVIKIRVGSAIWLPQSVIADNIQTE